MSPKTGRVVRITSTTKLFTTGAPDSLVGRVLLFPPVRMVLCVLFLSVFLIPHNTIFADLIASTSGGVHRILNYVDVVVSIAFLLLLYRLFARWVEGRHPREIGLEGAAPEFGLGFLISLGIVGFMVLAMAILGAYRVETWGPAWVLVDALFRFAIGAFVQVLFFRLILFRYTEELLGTWLALILVAIVFGLAHAANENSTAWTTTALMLGDVLLAGAFILTHRLWMVWGIHFGWNLVQDGIFGLANSGLTQFPSWITPAVDGPSFLTGGSFGIEASPIQVVLSLGVGVLLIKRAMAEGQIVGPAWKRGAYRPPAWRSQ